MAFINSSILDLDASGSPTKGLSNAIEWLAEAGQYSLVVIDAAESSGAPSDGAPVTEWFKKMIDPFQHRNKRSVGVLVLDHVPKRRQDCPRGAIGSQYKLARVDGAAFGLSGRPWTKTQDGVMTLRLEKDRPGDVPGHNILPNMLSTCMNVAEGYEELARWASKYMFLGVVWRCYEPGTKLDEIPILVGPGGIGKSTLPALAVPQDIPRLYGSGLELNGTTQKMVESILGRAIVEIDEMAGVNAGDMSRIKAFISRLSDDGTRLAYKPTTESLPRRCVMIGTADRDQFLPYDPNLRRFVPIVLDKGDARRVRTYMAKYRDRLWAEAVVLYRNRVPAHLPPKLKERAEVAVREAVK